MELKPGRKFNMSYVIDKDNMEDALDYKKTETHFGIPWTLVVCNYQGFLAFQMFCRKPETKKWEIETDIKLGYKSGTEAALFSDTKLLKSDGNRGCGVQYLMKWDLVLQKVKNNGKVELDIEVTIKNTSGFEMEKLRNFDEKELSDVVLVVEDEKFYLSKMFLSFQSKYFKTLFLGEFKERNQEMVKLEKIEARSFQSFLELLHGESSINDNNIDALLQLGDMYDAPTVIRRCEEFLLKESTWTVAEKLELANMYALGNLKEVCTAEMSRHEEEEQKKRGQNGVVEEMGKMSL